MTQGSDVILERMMTLHPKVIDLTLARVERLLAALGNPERAIPPVIHIAGTNGKGSTQAMIRAGLEAEGATVHASRLFWPLRGQRQTGRCWKWALAGGWMRRTSWKSPG